MECKLKFAGFVVFSCPLKADSRMNIKKLLAASHHVSNIQPVLSDTCNYVC